MELKLITIDGNVPTELGSNRTFMELKFGCVLRQRSEISSSNRTFMELKSEDGYWLLSRHTF